MKMKTLLSAFIMLSVIGGIFSCKKSSNNSNPAKTAQISMRLTDAPANYDAVYIDIQQIGLTMTGQSEIFITPNRAGIYNLLSFRNGLDTLLVNTTIPAGTVHQIRLILGNNNSLVESGVSYPLSTPSAQESGLKLNFQTEIVAGASYVIWLDFDAGKSILLTGSGKYKLKPVIRAYSALTNGKIEGYITPGLALATVYAINGTDTSSAIPTSVDGHFVIGGLTSGSYQLLIQPAFGPYLPYITNVDVTYGAITNVGTITLHP
jgi:hypothetical protein